MTDFSYKCNDCAHLQAQIDLLREQKQALLDGMKEIEDLIQVLLCDVEALSQINDDLRAEKKPLDGGSPHSV